MSQTDEPLSACADAPARPPVVVKKYANRRLYNTESSSYITLDNLADMVRAGRDFVVYDARTGDDITRSVLTQIIVEEESKGRALLPTTFLRQLIGFYGDSLGGIVPRYLEHTMSAIARQQEQMRDAMQQTMGSLLPPGLEEMRRQNIAMMERAMSLFSPFYRPAEAGQNAAETAEQPVDPSQHQILALQHEVAILRARLAEQQSAASGGHSANGAAPSPLRAVLPESPTPPGNAAPEKLAAGGKTVRKLEH
jgi:polyhydroxyalkanoate synthesis repressor PhaR